MNFVDELKSLSSLILSEEKLLEYIAHLFCYHYESQDPIIHEFVEQLIRLGNMPKALLDLSDRYRIQRILQTTGVKVRSRQEIKMEIESRLQEQKFDGVSYLIDEAAEAGFNRQNLIKTFADGYINDKLQKSIGDCIADGHMEKISEFINELKLFDSIKFTGLTYGLTEFYIFKWKQTARDKSEEIPVVRELFRELKRLSYPNFHYTN